MITLLEVFDTVKAKEDGQGLDPPNPPSHPKRSNSTRETRTIYSGQKGTTATGTAIGRLELLPRPGAKDPFCQLRIRLGEP